MGSKSVSYGGVSAVASWGSGPEVTVTITSNPSNIHWRVKGKASAGDNATYISDTIADSESFNGTDGKSYIFQSCPGGNWSNGSDSEFTVNFDYTFKIVKGTGASITCSRSNGSTVSKGATFTVTAGQITGYNKTTFTVTGATLVSGTEDTYKVTGNVVITASATVQSFALTINEDANSVITVNRTKSPLQGASTGNLNNGTTIYYNDELRIAVEPSEGYDFAACTVNGSEFENGAIYVVVGDTNVVSSTTVKRYNLILNPDTGTEIYVSRINSPLQGAENTSWSSTEYAEHKNVIYHSDVLEIEFNAEPGYQTAQQLVNQKAFTSGNKHTVNGDVEIVTISGVAGIVNIYNGSQFDKYLIYIYNGSTWDQYIPYIYDGTKWNICS